MRRHVAVTLLAVACLGTARGDGRAQFEEGWASDDSWVRREALLALDPGHKDTPKILFSLLDQDDAQKADWFVRRAAVERLAAVLDKSKDARALAEKAAKGKKSPNLRADIATTLGLVNPPKDWAVKRMDLLKDLLADPVDSVRRAAARSLMLAKEKRSIELLLEAWEKEKDPQTRFGLDCREHLRALSRRDKGKDRPGWRAWWDQVKGAFKLDDELNADEQKQAREKEESEASHHTVSKGLEGGLGYRTRGKGDTKLLVIPESEYDLKLYERALKPLEDFCEVYFVELPDVSKFDQKELKLYEKTKIPFYPIDKLVEAFEEVRKERKIERFSLLAFGFNSLVAQRYLTLHDDHVARCVLIGAISGDGAWGNIIDKAQGIATSKKDHELVKLARSMLIWPDGKHDYEPKGPEEKLALRRRFFTELFANPLDPALEQLWNVAKEKPEPGESISPEFDTFRQKKSEVPLLVQIGAKAKWTQQGDAEKIKAHYPNGRLSIYEESAMFPPLEESAKWAAEMRTFLLENATPEKTPGKK
jgi:pimeloyl-ACP methyl ester carboxylesterase